MSKIIKIELELPEFEKELNISVSLRKDGEVITTSSFPTETKTNIINETQPIWKQQVSADIVQPKNTSTRSGNMMNMNF